MPQPPHPERAVFLSYASQDADAVRRIADALRASGIEVWFDQNELGGGDAWDQKIREQVASCALFLPIISANTQARLEGYFRIEWKLAAQRTHAMAEAKPFLLPVVIDGTRDAEAHVPGEFKAVQWTRLPAGETNAAFCARVKKLLGGDSVGPGADRAPDQRSGPQPKLPSHRPWLVPAIVGLAAALAVAIWQPWRSGTSVRSPAASPPATVSASAAEIARVRARIVPDRWNQGDFEAISVTLDRLIQTNPEDPDPWALRSIINSLQVIRLIDSGTKALEVGKVAAERALRYAPDSPLVQLALGMHFEAMISRGGDPQACRAPLDRALVALHPDALTRYAGLSSAYIVFEFETALRLAKAWLEVEPRASFPTFVVAQQYVASRRPAEAVKWAELGASNPDNTEVRVFRSIFEVQFFLHADLPASSAALDRIPAGSRTSQRIVYARWLLAMAEHRWDEALQDLARVPESFLFDVTFDGPKALLAGQAHQRAGRTQAAVAQFQGAERLLKDKLSSDAENETLRAALAFALASAGRNEEARSELALVEPVAKDRTPSIYRAKLVVLIAQTYGALKDFSSMAVWLRKMFAEPSQTPFTPGSLRIDPRFSDAINAPEIQALLKEFASLDQPSVSATAPDQKSVAVLAFKNLSDDKANEYFSDGISEELLNLLGKVPGLRVAGRNSAFGFKGLKDSEPEIAQKLGVAYIVNGSVQKAGSQVKIRARLISAADNFQIWSDTFTEELKDIFAVQDRIAGLIAQNLSLKLGTASRTAKPVNPEAHRLVLEGRHFWYLRDPASLAQAERAFNAAITIDPNFAQAYAGLADVCVNRATYALQDGTVVPGGNADELRRVRTEAQRAIALDPTLSEAYSALGYINILDGRFAEAERQFQIGLSLNPNYPINHSWLYVLRLAQGRLDLGLRAAEKVTELDPLWAINLTSQAEIFFLVGRHAEALQLVERVVALRPDGLMVNLGNRARILAALGRQDEAVATARMIGKDFQKGPRRDADVSAIWVLRQAGLQAEAAAYVENYFKALPEQSPQRGFVFGALGRFEEAQPFLEKAATVTRRRLFWDAMWDPYRDDPRFHQLLAKLGCAEEYKVARETLARMLKEQAAKK